MPETEVHVVVGKRMSGKSSRLLTLARDQGGPTLVVVSDSASATWYRQRCSSAVVVVIATDQDGDAVCDDPAVQRLLSTGAYACVILDGVVYTNMSLLIAANAAHSVQCVLVSMTHPTMVPCRAVVGRSTLRVHMLSQYAACHTVATSIASGPPDDVE